jgi:hypothetical protein
LRDPYDIILREYEDQFSEGVASAARSDPDYNSMIDFTSPAGMKQFRLHAISAAERLKKHVDITVSWFAGEFIFWPAFAC